MSNLDDEVLDVIEEQEAEEGQQPDNAPAGSTAAETDNEALAELMEKGSITLTAPTREQLQADALALIEAAEGRAYATGAAGFDSLTNTHKITIKTY